MNEAYPSTAVRGDIVPDDIVIPGVTSASYTMSLVRDDIVAGKIIIRTTIEIDSIIIIRDNIVCYVIVC